MPVVGSLFSGCGLLDYGLHLAGWRHLWLCEKDDFRRGILKQRWPGIPVYTDVALVGDGAARPLLIAGGFPCKGVSLAGRREGFDHPETALWREMLRVVRELRPRYVLVENLADLLSMRPNGGRPGDLFGEVVGGLAESGYDAEWDCLPAAAFGAPHGRDRVFITAASDSERVGKPADRDLHRGDADGRSATGRAPLPAGPEVALPADALEGDPGTASDSECLGWSSGSGLRAGESRGQRRRRSTDGSLEAFPWGDYEAAVERWEEILGRAHPEPLIRRVDDGYVGRVVRSRLSALGDGVLVQAGWFVGARLLQHLNARSAA